MGRSVAKRCLHAAGMATAGGEHRPQTVAYDTGRVRFGRVAVRGAVDSIGLRAIGPEIRRELTRVAPPTEPAQIASLPNDHLANHQRIAQSVEYEAELAGDFIFAADTVGGDSSERRLAEIDVTQIAWGPDPEVTLRVIRVSELEPFRSRVQ